jgi:hypothetical protein
MERIVFHPITGSVNAVATLEVNGPHIVPPPPVLLATSMVQPSGTMMVSISSHVSVHELLVYGVQGPVVEPKSFPDPSYAIAIHGASHVEPDQKHSDGHVFAVVYNEHASHAASDHVQADGHVFAVVKSEHSSQQVGSSQVDPHNLTKPGLKLPAAGQAAV